MTNRAEIVLLLGSNMGDKKALLIRAISCLSDNLGDVIKESSIYKTEAWGFEADAFFNQLVIIKTHLKPEECLKKTQETEKKLGRQNKSKNGKYEDRLIDIDILFYENLIMETENLTIPHPKITERRFVLAPLNECIPQYIHPQFKKDMQLLLEECKDQTAVIKTNE